MSDHQDHQSALSNLLDAFRKHYYQFEDASKDVIGRSADTFVLSRLGDDLDEYNTLLNEYSHVFDPNEIALIRTNVATMQQDIRQEYDEALEASHHGRPELVHVTHPSEEGRRGRPSYQIDRQFLEWAYHMRSTTGIAHFLGVSRTVVRNALLRYGIRESGPSPFASQTADATQLDSPQDDPHLHNDDLLDPNMPYGDLSSTGSDFNPNTIHNSSSMQPMSYTGLLSEITDEELDSLVWRLRTHYRRAGITMMDGMLRRLGYRVPRERIGLSLHRIDPVHRAFQRITIRRRVYSVPGPNALWHHDGQHGLIRWGIVIHGFIDGYSRLITGLRASNNNLADTVLALFFDAAREFAVPSRLRGDHGVENVKVAAWMEENRGFERGSYIWGRSVHNVRIERLWADVTVQVGAAWAETFTVLELQHGLNINSSAHIWLLHYLFLPSLNAQLKFWSEAWNQHKIQIRSGPNRSPADLFVFDSLALGLRGALLPTEDDIQLSLEELEVYGIDWEGLQDEQVLGVRASNNPVNEDMSSWIGQRGPPPRLSGVELNPPDGPLTDFELNLLQTSLDSWYASQHEPVSMEAPLLWSHALALCTALFPAHF